MTEVEAIQLAQKYVVEHHVAVILDPPERTTFVTAMESKTLLGDERFPFDFWLVCFTKQLPPGVVAEDPSNIAISVEVGGRVYRWFPGERPPQ